MEGSYFMALARDLSIPATHAWLRLRFGRPGKGTANYSIIMFSSSKGIGCKVELFLVECTIWINIYHLEYHLNSASLSFTVLSTAWSFCFRLFTI